MASECSPAQPTEGAAPPRLEESSDCPQYDLSQCESEPVHRLGHIQPHGTLLAFERATGVVAFVSENLGSMLGIDPTMAIGQEISRVLPGHLRDQMSDLLSPSHAAREAGRLTEDLHLRMTRREVSLPDSRGMVEVFSYASGKYRVLEIVFLHDQSELPKSAYRQLLSQFVDSSNGVVNIYRIARMLVETVRRGTEFDRVMLYRFEEDWSGEVIAEDRVSEAKSYIGLRFPASDIPPQARALYQRNPFRAIADIHSPRVALLPAVDAATALGEGHPLDLSGSVLRSVSPSHIEYLRNMGVVSSASVSILVEGRLWGLIAMHHLSPRIVSWRSRLFALEAARRLEERLYAARVSERTQVELRVNSLSTRLREEIGKAGRVLTVLVESSLRIPQLLECDGFSIFVGDEAVSFGGTLNPGSLANVVRGLDEAGELRRSASVARGQVSEEAQGGTGKSQGSTEIGGTNCIKRLLDVSGDGTAGVLVGIISRQPLVGVACFRREITSEIHWGGNPHRVVHYSEANARLEPRRSFELWKEVHRDHCKPWSAQDRAVLEAVLDTVGSFLDTEGDGPAGRLQIELREYLQRLDSITTLRDLITEYSSRDPVICICNRRNDRWDQSKRLSVIPSASFCHMFRIDGFDFEETPEKTLRHIGIPAEILGDTLETMPLEVWSPVLGHRSVEARRFGLLDVVTENGSISITGIRFQDKTFEHGLQEALSSVHSEVEEARVTRFNILSNMSHELRTPLNVILGFAQIIAMEKDGPLGSLNYKKYLDEILRAGKHLTDLIDQALDFAKVESGHYALVEDEIDLRDPIRDACTWVGEIAEARGISLETFLPESPCYFRGETKALRQVFLNLLHNAIKFTPSQGVVSTSLSRLKSGSYVAIVKDTGVGIAPALLPYIFRPFVQADRSRSRRTSGTGIGLSVVKSLVELHGGNITVESVEGQGTSFSVIFPAWRAVSPDMVDGALVS